MHCDGGGVTLSLLNLNCRLCTLMVVVLLFHVYISMANYALCWWWCYSFTFTLALQIMTGMVVLLFQFLYLHCKLCTVLMVGAQAVQVKNSIHFSSSLLRITLHKFQQIWWKFTMNPSKVKRQSYYMISRCFIQYRCVEISQLVK